MEVDTKEALTDYPEHDRLRAISEDSQVIGEFLDNCGWTLCDWREEGDNGEPKWVWRQGVETAKRNGKPTADMEPILSDYLNDDAANNFDYAEWDEGFYPVRRSVTELLACYFNIDLDKIESEKRQMLKKLRGDSL